MSSLFPFIDTTQSIAQQSASALSIPHEYDWDYDNDCLKLVDGKPQIVSGLKAIKVWCWNALQTDRYRYIGYTWSYGHELKALYGRGFTQEAGAVEVQRYTKECLLVNPYITDVTDFSISFSGDTVTASFKIVTPYGEESMNVSV
jgi:hypothetical protein